MTALRVVVTGLGVVSSVGTGVAEFTEALRAGRCGARPITVFDTTGFAHAQAGEVDGFVPERLLTLPPADLGRAARFAAAAGRMAVADAGLSPAGLADRPGLVAIGTTDGGSHELDLLVEAEIRDGPENLDPVLARQTAASTVSVAVARELGLGLVETVTVATACAAGNYALGTGLDALRAGDVEFALCGGADALNRRNFTGFYRLGLLTPDACHPFDARRSGIVTAEGAAVLVLETAEAAERRNARIYADFLGYGLNCDAQHPTTPTREGVAQCMRLGLADAGVKPAEVDLISAHGTGTQVNDLVESQAIRDVFGADPPRVTALKAMFGHAMGAASALAACACVLAVAQGFIPPTVNHGETDPDCGVDCVAGSAVDAEIRVAQNNGLAFGGNNAVVLFGRCAP